MLAILPQLRGTHDFNLEDDPVHRSRLDGKPAVTVPRHVIAYSMTGEFAHIRGRTTRLPLAWRSMCTLLSCTRLYDPLIRATMLILDCRHPQMNCDSCISICIGYEKSPARRGNVLLHPLRYPLPSNAGVVEFSESQNIVPLEG